ncbi:hypothetical protein AMELA_G00031370 [Ameiurus melas]|uniref:Uncharacterized protein n=1 Tax=Ameiurus melas TaxID=219545 RepID=A0A7J6B924_AMEME|nr:hypothetical protein AMELA_G00031370 [Ameiurus melas]
MVMRRSTRRGRTMEMRTRTQGTMPMTPGTTRADGVSPARVTLRLHKVLHTWQMILNHSDPEYPGSPRPIDAVQYKIFDPPNFPFSTPCTSVLERK